MSTTKPTAIVVAAGRGMGAACARELANRGYELALFARSPEVDAFAAELDAIAIRGSLLESADLDRLVDTTMRRYGRIDAVINSTGHPPKGPLLELGDDDWHAGLDMVVLNVVRICRLVTPIMRAQGSGAIVNISTFAAFEPSPDFPISSSLRAALAGFTKLYADRYAADGIRINNILPGFIDSYPADPEIEESIPLGRYGTVDEVAATAAFLVSDGAGYITGQNIRVDGGLTRSV